MIAAVTTVVGRERLAKYPDGYAVPDGSESVRVREGDTPRLEWLVAGQTAAKSRSRFAGDDLATVGALELTVLADFVRDVAGQVA